MEYIIAVSLCLLIVVGGDLVVNNKNNRSNKNPEKNSKF